MASNTVRSYQLAHQVAWIRNVTSLTSGEGIRQFYGYYLPLVHTNGTTAYDCIPGNLYLTSCPTGQEHLVRLYINLPEDIWYLVPNSEMLQTQGWHDLMRPLVRRWINLRPESRIHVACLAVINHYSEIAAESFGWTYAQQVIAQYERIRQSVMPHDTRAIGTEERACAEHSLTSFVRKLANDMLFTEQEIRNTLFEILQTQVNTVSETKLASTPKKALAIRPNRHIRVNQKDI